MRWKVATDGDARTKTRFLWFPKCIDSEMRWLEKATFEQKYRWTDGWTDIKWIN